MAYHVEFCTDATEQEIQTALRYVTASRVKIKATARLIRPEKEVLDMIEDRPMSVRQLMHALDRSYASVEECVRILMKKDLIHVSGYDAQRYAIYAPGAKR